MAVVLLTDFAWPDDSIERRVVEAAGHRLVSGPSTPLSTDGIERLVADCEPQAIMTCWARVSQRAIGSPKDLRIVQRLGVGIDNIAVEAATARGTWVANVPDYCVDEVSDHAIALLLDWARGTTAFDRDVKRGHWRPASAKLRRVSELVVGIVGYGAIGRRTVAKLAGFGCKLLLHRASGDPVEGASVVTLDALLAASDVVILHAPLTPATRHLINADRLGRCKSGAFLINVSRGDIVDTKALVAALESGALSGAGLDVVEGEPEPPRALVERPDVIVTPHVAFSSDASLAELRRRAAEQVVRVLGGGTPIHPCNTPKGHS